MLYVNKNFLILLLLTLLLSPQSVLANEKDEFSKSSTSAPTPIARIFSSPVATTGEEQAPSPSRKRMSWGDLAKLPYYFADSLVRPVATGLSDFCTEQCFALSGKARHHLQSGGSIGEFLWEISQDALRGTFHRAKDHPLDTATLAFMIVSPHIPHSEASSVIMPVGVSLLNGLTYYTRWIRPLRERLSYPSRGSNITKVLVYGGALYCIAGLPTAAAWNSLSEAKDHFTGDCFAKTNPLKTKWEANMHPIMDCLATSHDLYKCGSPPFATPGMTGIRTLFIRHPSSDPAFDPVSITEIGDRGNVCIITALRSGDPSVVKTCLSLKSPSTRDIELLPHQSIQRAHEGLEPGQTVNLMELRLGRSGCAHFADPHLTPSPPEDGTFCVLTALRSSGDVSQLCLNPQNPGALSLRPAPQGLSLDFGNADGKPMSIIVKNPRLLGLDVGPDRPLKDSTPNPDNPPPVCEDGHCYKYEKVEVPCPKT